MKWEILKKVFAVILGLCLTTSGVFADGTYFTEKYSSTFYMGSGDKILQRTAQEATEEQLFNSYIFDPNVQRIIVKGNEKSYLSRTLPVHPGNTKWIFSGGGYVDYRYLMTGYNKTNALIIWKNAGSFKKDWYEGTKIKLPLGAIVVDHFIDAKKELQDSNDYYSIDSKVKKVLALQYKVFVDNMRMGYIDTETTLLSYYKDKEAIMYKYLEIYNSDNSPSKMELYNKIQEFNDINVSETLANDINKIVDEVLQSRTYAIDATKRIYRDDNSYMKKLLKINHEKEFIDSLSMNQLKALIVKIKAGKSNTPSIWAEEAFRGLKEKGMIDENFLKGSYQRDFNRGEFAMLAVKLYENANKSIISTPNENQCPYTDIKYNDYHDYIKKAYAAGIIKEDNSTTYNPNKAINREQMARMIVSLLKTLKSYNNFVADSNSIIADISDITTFVKDDVIYTVQNGIMTTDTKNKFCPKDNLTIEQAALVFYRLANN